MNILSTALDFGSFKTDDPIELKLRSLTIKRWLKTDEVALYLGISKGAVRIMTHRRKLTPRKYCGRNYFHREEIDNLIESTNVDNRRFKCR